MEYKYHLQKYDGPGTRHECPKCHYQGEFTLYVDENNNPIHPTVGRCNRESKCGYHFTPRQYYKENNQNFIKQHHSPTPPPPLIMPDFIPKKLVLDSLSFDNNLCEYLCGLFPTDMIQRAWGLYAIGATKYGGAIYWQIDTNQKVRTGKVINYNPDTGHRVKEKGCFMIHTICMKQGIISQSFNMIQCLFGEHLLSKYPSKSVALVEAEKTALIASMVFDDYVWVAVGGKKQLSYDRVKTLEGRRVTVFPDGDAFKEWTDKVRELRTRGLNMRVSDIIERTATPQQKASGIDIADLIISDLVATSPTPPPVIIEKSVSPILERMKAKNPTINELIEKLDLEVVA